MKAIILAAGLGTRLKKITSNKPKALVEINGITMLEMVITKLKSQGISKFLINIHHHGQSIIDYLDKNKNFGVDIHISDERNQLLGTGGAILLAKDFIIGNETVLIHNVDIISDVDIDKLEKQHFNSQSVASLCVRKRKTKRYLLFDDNMKLTGWTNDEKQEFKWVREKVDCYDKYAFSGIYLISPDFVEDTKHINNFSIIDSWLEIAKSKLISGFLDETEIWHDLGTQERICKVEKK